MIHGRAISNNGSVMYVHCFGQGERLRRTLSDLFCARRASILGALLSQNKLRANLRQVDSITLNNKKKKMLKKSIIFIWYNCLQTRYIAHPNKQKTSRALETEANENKILP